MVESDYLKMKIGIISSSGGHLFTTSQLKKWWGKNDRFWVVPKDGFSQDQLKTERTYQAFSPEQRNLSTMVKNTWLAIRVLRKERPDLIFSTGAGVAPPFFLIAKLLGIKTIFMEAYIFNPRPTLSGKLIYPIADLFIVQHQDLLKTYPRAKYLGSVL